MDRVPQECPAREPRSGTGPLPECAGEVARFDGSRAAANDFTTTVLARTIEQQVIPRLMLAHRTPGLPTPPELSGAQSISEDDVRQFTQMVLASDDLQARERLAALRARGVSSQEICLDLLAPTARHLGWLWEEDLCTFTDVTIGAGRLQRMLRELGSVLEHRADEAIAQHRILLVPAPREQHTFGLSMVAEFFREAGWLVTGGAWAAEIDTLVMLGAEAFDAVGFSLGSEVNLKLLANEIRSVRKVSCNKHITILVGGPLFNSNPELATAIGADAVSTDASQAPALALQLVSQANKGGRMG